MAYLVQREPRVPQRGHTLSDAVHKVSNALHGHTSTGSTNHHAGRGAPCDGDIAFARSCHSAKARVELEAEMYRCALDFSDVEAILRSATAAAELQQSTVTDTHSVTTPPALFQPIARDGQSGITLFSAPVEGCPMRMMCAHAVMPCSAAAFLQYMDTGVRPLWDKHNKCSLLIRSLTSLLTSGELPGQGGECEAQDALSAAKTARLSKALLLHAEYGKPSSGLSLAAMTTSSAEQAAARSVHDTAATTQMTRTTTTMHIDGVGPRLASLTRRHTHHGREHTMGDVTSREATVAAAHAVAAAAAAAGVVSANRSRAASYARQVQADNNNNNNSNNSSSSTTATAKQKPILSSPSVAEEEGRTPLSASLLSRPALRPGEHRVGLHYLGVKSPVAFVQDRDFELVVGECVRGDGVAYMKAFSPPLGYAMPLDPHQSRYVRGVVLLAAVVARPYRVRREQPSGNETQPYRGAATPMNSSSNKGEEGADENLPPVFRDANVREYCKISYLGLVHPMGLLPAVIVNVVTSVQMNALKQLQQFILHHPLPSAAGASQTTAAEVRLLRGVSRSEAATADEEEEDTNGGGRGSVLDEIIDDATSEPSAQVPSKL